ncbi:unnamed protein product, partial [Discosporangium mesarthrocarpum]
MLCSLMPTLPFVQDLRSATCMEAQKPFREGVTQALPGGKGTAPKNPGSSELSSASRGRLWRLWVRQWVDAVRYMACRQLTEPHVDVETVEDGQGGVHRRYHESLFLRTKAEDLRRDPGPSSRAKDATTTSFSPRGAPPGSPVWTRRKRGQG